MTRLENIMRAVRFDGPERIPMNFSISAAYWDHCDQDALQDLMEAHPLLFPNFKRQDKVECYYGVNARKDEPYTDPWGCVWQTTMNGITGTVTGHPLVSWDAFDDYQPPDPEKSDGLQPNDLAETARRIRARKEKNGVVTTGLRHGHTFMQLCDIRGYEALILDMADDEPRLWKLIDMVEQFNLTHIGCYLEAGADWVSYPEDLGMQNGPMLSPDHFRKYIKPTYQRMMKPAREKGLVVHMHSDGCIRDLVDDLIDGGVEIINLQDLANGIDWIATKFAGKVCVDLDIDRQDVVPRGTPAQIDALIREEVEKLGSKEGGLMMIHGLYPGVPLENAGALMDAMEKYSTYYS